VPEVASARFIFRNWAWPGIGWIKKLERAVVPMYYGGRERWIDVMAHAIALNGAFFHTHRMVQQYVLNASFQ
jgi:hypothetical protein